MPDVHLLVLIHGMWVKGEVEDGDIKLEVLLAETNKDESTYDGIDWGGERVAEEIRQKTADLEKEGRKVTRFSVTGYSLGGLVARYVIGRCKPVNFNTLATPHIGIPRFPSTFSSISAFLGPKLLSRSGEQFFCVDKCAEDPFGEYEKNGIKIDFHEKYKHVIKSYSALPLSSATTREPEGWFDTIRNMRAPLPPRFQAEFPLNLAVYTLLPILFPTFICLLSFACHFNRNQSRGRVRHLEAQTTRERLVHIIAKLESELESAAVDLYDDPAGTPIATSPIPGADPADPTNPTEPTKEKGKKSRSKATSIPHFSIENLNKIPQLKKERAFFEGVRNSHAMIICQGEGVLRHWADHFDL
ncbi:putative serine esterase-domain-containing protein [Suillus subalutaceus]|uniref:putative serine esterase-domain-containing protein n=1 Tax=Suillus subalutaceus TaxID=48586 RepID=UPI001B86464F|nr:putative serine esterase-domain-containing protein [Suillus subalutaceus]KAG1860744.1 putative serine esterase-domain-containing protein [Suillus subalutaceus]